MSDSPEQPPPHPGGGVSDNSPVDDGPVTLHGRYRLDQLIAEGGMAAVWRGRDEVLARPVAVKVLHDHLASDEEFVERFRREAIAAAKLAHPHVVSIYDSGKEGRRAWLVMELVEGVTLRDVMDQQGTLDVAHAAAIGERIARGLAFAHAAGLVHRDVKPANILLGDDGTVKVTDFGIAKAAGAGSDLTGTGTVLGTAAYVAPEQIRSEPLDGACDQYALGCVLYEALTGRRPFEGTTAIETAARRLTDDPAPVCTVRPDLPAALGAVVDRTLSREPAGRYPTAADLADALAPFTSSSGTLTLPAAVGHDDAPAEPGAPSSAPAGPPPAQAPETRPAFAPEKPPAQAPESPPGSPAGRPGWPAPGPAPAARSAPGPAPAARSAHSGGPAPAAHSAPAGPAPRGRPAPSGRPRQRGLTVAAAVVGVVAVLLVGAVGAGLFDREPPSTPDATPQMPEPGDSSLVTPVDVRLFDPGGTGSEDAADLPALLDGDPTTSWRSVGYNTADFGGLKPGLGFWVDLGDPHELDSVTLATDTPGFRFEIRTASEPASGIDGWQTVGSQAGAPAVSEVVFDSPVVSRYVLVWITGDLPPDGGRYRVQLTELALRGHPR